MYSLRKEIINLTDRKINDNLYVKDGIVYVLAEGNKFIYDGTWFIEIDNIRINLQDGIPNVISNTNLDPDIFEEIIKE